jgi:membrane protein implicated in regulation of membrane protease activity
MTEDFMPGWMWLSAGLLLCALEALAPGVFLLWIGLAALATGLLVMVVPLAFAWTLMSFGGFVVVLVLVGRAVYGSRNTNSDRPFLNRRAESLIGQEFVLHEPISEGAGHIRVADSIWRVAGPDLPAGSRVKVTGVEKGVLLRVEPA